MKKTIIMIAVALLLVIGLSSCGTALMLGQDTKEYPQAESGKAALVIYRALFYGRSAVIDFYVDNQYVGSTDGYSYFVTQLDPGEHYIALDAEMDHLFKINVEAGKVYFAFNGIAPGFITANGTLEPTDKARFDNDLDSMTYYIVNPEVAGQEFDDWEDTVSEYHESKEDDPDHNDGFEDMKGY